MFRIRKRDVLLFLLLVQFFIIRLNWAEEKKISHEKFPIFVESNVDRADITIGDIVKYSLCVTYDSSIKLELPSIGINLGEFEIKDYKVSDPEKKDDGKIVFLTEYLITTFTTGDYIIPPVIIKYKEREKDIKEIQSEKIFIRVHKTSPKQGDKEDIRGLKNVTELELSYAYYIAGIILLLLIIAYVVYLFYRKKIIKNIDESKAIPTEPPYERAIREMKELKNSDLLSSGEIKDFFIALSEIQRRYISGRYNILALDRTTDEIIAEFKSIKIKWDIVGKFKDILDFSDLVKFAKFIPEINESEKMFDQAFELVNLTRPEDRRQRKEDRRQRTEERIEERRRQGTEEDRRLKAEG